MAGNYNYGNSREWMYRRVDEATGNISAEFTSGVEEFVAFANSQPLAQRNGGKFYCPCLSCENEKFIPGSRVLRHLYNRGFMPDYSVWHKHGEELNMDIGTSNVDRTHVSGSEVGEGWCVDMVNDAFRVNVSFDNYHQDGSYQNVDEPTRNHSKKFNELLDRANTPLYDGCREGHSQLSLAARIMQKKADYNWSENSVDAVCGILTDYLPEGNKATGSHYETDKLMRNLGLPYHEIDVCINNCMIFWKEDEKFDKCRFCNSERWMPNEQNSRYNVPYSRMWYMPIGDRLKRMYQSEKTAYAMRWHAMHEANEGEMCHPSDAAEWKNFQAQHPQFAEEKRNVYLGLCTDGFNPFGMSKNHSLWPVILTPYNLPPGMCMNTEYLFLTVMNSGPKHPRASLDIFLRPLIDELKELWSTGVDAYDAYEKENFTLKAVLLWTISDFPAYGMLSGWTTHGKLACPICMADTKSFYLARGRKTCWFDCHRRFLPHDHRLRKNRKDFLKKRDASNDYPPETLTGDQIYRYQLKRVNPPKTKDVGGNGHDKKKPGFGKEHNWHKESIFWELPYWRDLNLRHNLDLMHIEKNFFDNIMNTLMRVKGKSKDNIPSRLDIAALCSRPHLHIDDAGEAPFPPYSLEDEARTTLLECVKHSVKFPDGYASNLASCVDLTAGKFSGMKSHDCHVFMERLLPFICAELLNRNVHTALSGVGLFFRDLCSRTLQKSHVQILKQNIVLILCQLEKIFPPSFFDVMEHLPVHLPDEAELGGPVQYRWMYPFERFFKKLKGKANNPRYPAGSIVQSYLREEAAYFTEHYFPSTIQTKSRLSARFAEGEVPEYNFDVPDIFTHVGRPSGEMQEIRLSEKDCRCAHAYVLRNCGYFEPLDRYFEDYISVKYPDLSQKDIMVKQAEEYPSWIEEYVTCWNAEVHFPTWVLDIIHGPVNKAKTWPMYYTRGYLFHTKKHNEGRRTCNYGVCVTGEDYSNASNRADFHGQLTDIMEIEYAGMVNLRITLFKCKWYDPVIPRGTRISNGGIVDVLHSGRYYKYEPFILASQADQVCYIPYPEHPKPKLVWQNVVKVNPRGNISGDYVNTEPTLLQQETDHQVLLTTIEDLVVDNSLQGANPINLDYEVGDAEPEDEFQCNLSESDDDASEGEAPY